MSNFNVTNLSIRLGDLGWSQSYLAGKMIQYGHANGHPTTLVRPSHISSWMHGSEPSGFFLYLLCGATERPPEFYYTPVVASTSDPVSSFNGVSQS